MSESRNKTPQNMKTQNVKFRFGRDINGNKVLRVSKAGSRGFSIQTNGNLPETHRDGIGPYTAGEVRDYIRAHGTQRRAALVASGE